MPKEDAHFNGKLVEAVEKLPCLYNFHLKDYRNREKVHTAWATVALEVDSSEKECKQIWRNLRTVFIRALKKPPSASGKQKKKYYLVDTKQFLLPYINTKKDESLPGNLPSPPTTSNEQCETNEMLDDIDTVKVMDQTDSRTIGERNEASESAFNQQANDGQSKAKSANSSVDRSKKRTKNAEVDECVMNYIRSKSESKESNPRKLFLLSLLPDVEEMDSNQFRSFRQQVIHLIDNTLSSSRPYSRAEQPQTPYSWSSSGSFVPQLGVPNQENVLSPTESPNELPDEQKPIVFW